MDISQSGAGIASNQRPKIVFLVTSAGRLAELLAISTMVLRLNLFACSTGRLSKRMSPQIIEYRRVEFGRSRERRGVPRGYRV
jgi:hypothetical protein